MHGLMRVPAKRFHENTYHELFDYGVGAFVWREGPPARLLLLIPWTRGSVPYELVALDVQGWGPGGLHGWNGDIEAPTIYGSIAGYTFHGWLLDGYLTDKQEG